MRVLSKSAMVVLAIAVAIFGTAVAQDQPAQQGASPGWSWGPRGMMGYGFMGPGMMGDGAMGPWMMGRSRSAEAICNAMGSHIEGRLAYLKAELKVTDAQEPLWNAYAAAARDNAKTMIARCTTMMGKRDSQVSLPDRLDQNEQLMGAQLDAMRAMDKALKPLYAALTDGQKKSADQLFWSPMGMM
ncbi:Spy/CpxP family protein refolding chaperone [Bradyrhizobium sp. JR3.5]